MIGTIVPKLERIFDFMRARSSWRAEEMEPGIDGLSRAEIKELNSTNHRVGIILG